MAKYGINALVIGERIKQELKKQGKTSVWLAEQLGCHRTNIYKVYERATIDTGLLFHISKLLSFDFFKLYSLFYCPIKRGSTYFANVSTTSLGATIYILILS